MSPSRLLVVDDDLQIRRVLRTMLAAQGYSVDDAASGEDALERLKTSKFDLVVLDMNMPGLGGLETCRAIRSGSDIGIVVLTVRDGEPDKIGALDAGADDYVTKPFSSPELIARIRAALRRVPPLSKELGMVRFDDIEVNFETRRVVTGGSAATRLTPKESDLLHYMMTHPNVVIHHTRLLQAVWGPEYGKELEYLRVFVNQLRKKIEKNPSKPRYILTEPWVGYRFNLPR